MKNKMNKHIIVIMGQAIFLVLVLAGIFFIYPRANVYVNGNIARFDSINANVIVISENPDFSNPRYIDFSESKNFSFDLRPGTYYWKSDNGIIEGMSHEFTIDSEVGVSINRSDNESNLVNVGNVKVNVTKNENGVMVGRIILEPDESQKIEDNGGYVGRQG